MMKVLVTGSEGLIGTSLCKELEAIGWTVTRFDIRRDPSEDVRSFDAMKQAASDVDGVVHLAAISRVVWAQQDPEACQQVNIEAIRNLTECLSQRQSATPPWLLFASSREVYGQQADLPVPETAPLQPMNIYARSKVEGETIVLGARSSKLTTSIVRLSSVYGSPHDHKTRVTPAFARAAAEGGQIRIEGRENTFDFVHVNDVVQALMKMIELTSKGENIDPIHLCSGQGTTLDQLASLAASLSNGKTEIVSAPPRDFDVGKFIGCPKRAKEVLGWEATTPLRDGFEKLVQDIRDLQTE